jgi:hypothetical protein
LLPEYWPYLPVALPSEATFPTRETHEKFPKSLCVSAILSFLSPKPISNHLDYEQSTTIVLFSFFVPFFLSENPSLPEKQKKLEKSQ